MHCNLTTPYDKNRKMPTKENAMPITLSDEELEKLKKAFMYQLISHNAYFDNNVLFRAMKDSGDFEKVVVEPLKSILKWSPNDDAEKERIRKTLLEKAQEGRNPEDWYKSAKRALEKEFKITGKDIAVVTGGAVALGTAVYLGGKVVKALFNGGKKKKKTGD